VLRFACRFFQEEVWTLSIDCSDLQSASGARSAFKMPRTCAEMGVLERVVPLHQVPEQILLAIRYYSRSA
jgi:chemotaxis response regulator CheB